MNSIILFILGVVVGGIVVFWWLRLKILKQPTSPEGYDRPRVQDDSLIAQQGREKAENLAKIRELLERQNRVTNDDIEKFLNVSDATATRYLDELERQGVIRQVGQSGKYVYYEKV